MSHLPFTILAYLLNGVAVLIDKFMLKRAIPDPLIYVFYFSAFSSLALLALPFINTPPLFVIILASASTLIWTTGAYLMFTALKIGQISRVIPIIGALVPIFLTIYYQIIGQISGSELSAIFFLLAGLILLIIPNLKGKLPLLELILEISAAFLFASSYIILKQAYLGFDFLPVIIWSRVILIPVGILILALPVLKKRVFQTGSSLNFFSKMGLIFLFGQACGGISQLLITFSISLANPSLVNSLQGVQYIFLFLAALLLSKKIPQVFTENRNFSHLSLFFGIILTAIGIYLLAFKPLPAQSTNLGVTFSPTYAKYLGLEYKQTYLEILDELQVKLIRIPTYWSKVEEVENQFNFEEVDFLVTEAQKRGVEVLLVVGLKQPRWPECHLPAFIKDKEQILDSKLLKYIETTVLRYKDNSAIWGYQVENEPFFEFGEDCPKISQETVKKEVELVRSISPKPIIVTDSGEWGLWKNSADLADFLGVSVYRKAYNPILGYINYPIPMFYYQLKSQLLKPQDKELIITELQAEPWLKLGIQETETSQQLSHFTPQTIQDNVNFAKKLNSTQIYLWGVEWWYYLKTSGYPEAWQTAKVIFTSDTF